MLWGGLGAEPASREESERADASRAGRTLPHTSGWRALEYLREKHGLASDPCVYEPSDDTEIAAEALLALAREERSYSTILEVGSGTGVLSLLAYELFRPRRAVAIDLSPFAARLSRRNLPSDILVARCDGVSCVQSTWDLVILNPPYLPVEPRSLEPSSCEEWLDIAWSGGGLVEKLVRDAIAASVEAVVVLSSLTPLDVEKTARELGKKTRVLSSRRFFFEELRAYHIMP